jgi:hypothetical protein
MSEKKDRLFVFMEVWDAPTGTTTKIARVRRYKPIEQTPDTPQSVLDAEAIWLQPSRIIRVPIGEKESAE